MTTSLIIIGALGVAVGSLLVWLPIRIFNRGWRDRKARLGIALLFALVGYPAMLGPSCWISSRTGWGSRLVTAAYLPLKQQSLSYIRKNTKVIRLESPFTDAFDWYSECGAPQGWHWAADWDSTIRNTPQSEMAKDLHGVAVKWDWQFQE